MSEFVVLIILMFQFKINSSDTLLCKFFVGVKIDLVFWKLLLTPPL